MDKVNIDDGDDFLREILSETPQSDVNGGVEVVNNMIKSKSSDSIMCEQQHQQERGRCCLPKTFILSFDNSTIIPATTPEPCLNLKAKRGSNNKRNRESSENSEMMKRNEQKVAKKGKSGSQCIDHIIAERKRRQELTERFIALSATIPGLSKVSKLLNTLPKYAKQNLVKAKLINEKVLKLNIPFYRQTKLPYFEQQLIM